MCFRASWFTAVCITAVAGAASAQQARDDGGSARLQAMVQQLTTEKTRLEADNAKLKADLDKVNASLKSLGDEQADLRRRLGQSEASRNQASAANTRSTALIEQQQTRMDEIVAQFRQTIEVLRTTEIERNELRTALASRESAFNQCAAANQKLFETGNEVLDRYEDKGCFSSMRENEPFTQNRRVRLQNSVDEYRWAFEDQKLPESAAPATELPAATTDGT
jgi:chromosome segregation ATPase